MLLKSVAFVRELNRTYGHDKAHEVWQAVVDSVQDPELTFEVYKLMISGQHDEFVLLKWDDPREQGSEFSNMVSSIKTLRSYTGCGLKEAKEAIERAGDGIPARFRLLKQHDQNGNLIDFQYEIFQRDMQEALLHIEYI